MKTQLKKVLSGAFVATSLLLAASATNAMPSITVNPSAANGDAANKQLDIPAGGQQGSYVVNSIQTTLASALDIAATAGATTWTESGALIFTTYNSATFLNGNRAIGTGQYDVYGTFLGGGGGFWSTPTTFVVTSINSFTIQIWGSPQSGSTLTYGNASSGTDASGGIGQGNKDFLLGTATFAGSFGGTGAQLGAGNNATIQLTAQFNFTPASAAYTGIGGYFEAPIPFVVAFAGSASSNSGQSTYAALGSGYRIRTAAGGGATGNLTVTVPEPGMLSLVGISLLGLAGLARRRSKAA